MAVEVVIVRVKPLYDDSRMPMKGSEEAAGWDLYAHLPDGPITLWQGRSPQKVSVGIATEIPQGYYAQIRGRSGLASQGLMVFDGTVDSDYRGEWFVVARCVGYDSMEIKDGDRIAQMVITPLPWTVLEFTNELTPSARGENGYGSTGR